jgi:Lrp/AsnC family transcriptional regulator, regulator for asnA, asnC and gidA
LKRAIDATDRRIVELLQESGRQSNSALARRLGLSEGTVRRRIDWLLSEGVLQISAVLNPLKFDYPIVAIIGIHAEPNRIEDVGRSLQAFGEFRFIGLTTGAYDFVTEAWFHSLEGLREFLTQRLHKVEGVTSVDVAHVLDMIRYAYDWSSRTASPVRATTGPPSSTDRLRP